jgi:DNA-binding MarR family transcriptional regulator
VLAAWRGFLRVHIEVVTQLDRDLVAGHDITLDWYDVLVQLNEAGGELTMGELSERMLIAPSTCTRIVERMCADGLVDRRVDDRDKRVRHAVLTKSGSAMLRRAAVTHLAGIQRYFGAALTDRQATELLVLFSGMHRPAGNSLNRTGC